jgi:hypothetical protein
VFNVKPPMERSDWGLHGCAQCSPSPHPPIHYIYTPNTPTAQTLTGFKTLLGLLAIAMPRLMNCCMGVTLTHPLPPLKRGGHRRVSLHRQTGGFFCVEYDTAMPANTTFPPLVEGVGGRLERIADCRYSHELRFSAQPSPLERG